ncbi:MAG: tRNA (adenosine(37)-N6)-dimethylallyltransferase MiaA [Planctomycetaceae bacterium]|nr:tRNA (adenosine(37)-N6)-dimethylallyltransferase MiaA [Planctomycetaceae bacterium]|tara:strand:+ start:1153 stop:2109 length:957 start_codon:yes stop_codon:yes gene_type:complete
MTEQTRDRLPAIDDSCWFLTGPTASGKTSAALVLAERIGAEIISLDSMAIYRGMDIGTAKPSLEQRSQVVHHMIDILDPNESFSVAEYLARAHRIVDEIRQRGNKALFVGGTPMYLKVLLRGIFGGPAADWEFRQQVEEQIELHGKQALHRQLAMVDPVSAHKFHPNDIRRVTRALEVYHLTGEPISHQQQEFESQNKSNKKFVFQLSWPRDVLHQRIEKRVVAMFEAGLVREVQQLLESYQELGRTALQAVGYREVLEHLKGERDLDETMQQVVYHTRRFARRQETWFRGFPECQQVTMTNEMTPEEVVDTIIDLVE